MSTPAAITFDHVSKAYETGRAADASRTVIDDLSFSIQRGEFVSLLGPSGCGKTTVLNLIADLVQPTSGTITVDGLTPEQARRQHRYGFVFQTPPLLGWRSVIRNVELPLELQHVDKAERRRRAQQVLDLVELTGYEDSLPRQLSGGMRQRVDIAMALVQDPDIILMDEPFSALDEFTKERLHTDLLRIWGRTGKTIVFVTHDIEEATFLSDRVAVLTTHPARLASFDPVDLPRPRTQEQRSEEAFFQAAARIRRQFSQDAPREGVSSR